MNPQPATIREEFKPHALLALINMKLAVKKLIPGILVLLLLSLLGYFGHRWWTGRRIQFLQNECEQARKDARWNDLESRAGELRRLLPTVGQPILYLAEASQMKKDLPKVVEYLSAFPRDDERAPLVLVQKSNFEWGELNRPWDALATCEEVIRLRPHTIYAHARIISFYAMSLQRQELLQSIHRAIKMGAEPREAYSYLMLIESLSFSNASAMNVRWMQSTDKTNPSQFRIAYAVFNAMNREQNLLAETTPENQSAFDESLQTVEDLLIEFPDHPALLGFLISRAIEEGNIERVEQLLEMNSPKNEGDPLLWTFRGWNQTIRNQLVEAEGSFQKALKLNPLSWRTRHEYAVLCRRQQKIELADSMSKLALEGKEIRKVLLSLPNAREIPLNLLQRISKYAETCADDLVSPALQKRLATLGAPENVETDTGNPFLGN